MRPRTGILAGLAWLTVGLLVAGWLGQGAVRAAQAPQTPACAGLGTIALRPLPDGEPYRELMASSPIIWPDGAVHPGAVIHTGLSFLAAGQRAAAGAMLGMLRDLAVDVDGFTLLPYRFDFRGASFDMRAPWYSAMDQGQALSLAVRLGDRTFAERLLPALLGPSPITRAVPGGLWLEEYPTDPPNPVLNGAVFAAFGLYDEWAATGSEPARGALTAALTTIRANVTTFRNPGRLPWYDLGQLTPVSPVYVPVYDEQMATLAAMTGDPCYAEMRAAFAYDSGG